jgi:hypothetical protein
MPCGQEIVVGLISKSALAPSVKHGDEVDVTFAADPQDPEHWVATVETAMGITHYTMDRNSPPSRRPSPGKQNWKGRIEYIRDIPNVLPQGRYYRAIELTLLYTVNGQRAEAPKPKPGGKAKSQAPANNPAPAEKPKIIRDVVFYRNPDGTWSSSRDSARDSTVELLVVELPPDMKLRRGIKPIGETREMSLPVNVRVLRVIDDTMAVKKYAVVPMDLNAVLKQAS